MPTGKLGKLWVRGGKVYAYTYPKGKKAARKLLRFYELTPSDLKKGADRYFFLRRLFLADGMSLDDFEDMISDIV